MPLWRRHLSVQALKVDVVGIQCLTDEVKHLGPVSEDDTRIRSATTWDDVVRIYHLLIGRWSGSSLYDSKFCTSAATFEDGL